MHGQPAAESTWNGKLYLTREEKIGSASCRSGSEMKAERRAEAECSMAATVCECGILISLPGGRTAGMRQLP
jgi:hypothetical protein